MRQKAGHVSPPLNNQGNTFGLSDGLGKSCITGQNHSAAHCGTNFYLSGKITEGKVRNGFFVNFSSILSDHKIADNHHHSPIGWVTRRSSRPADTAYINEEATSKNGDSETSQYDLKRTLLIFPITLFSFIYQSLLKNEELRPPAFIPRRQELSTEYLEKNGFPITNSRQ